MLDENERKLKAVNSNKYGLLHYRCMIMHFELNGNFIRSHTTQLVKVDLHNYRFCINDVPLSYERGIRR